MRSSAASGAISTRRVTPSRPRTGRITRSSSARAAGLGSSFGLDNADAQPGRVRVDRRRVAQIDLGAPPIGIQDERRVARRQPALRRVLSWVVGLIAHELEQSRVAGDGGPRRRTA